MDTRIAELERSLLVGEGVGLASGALVASGVSSVRALERHLDAIDSLHNQLEASVGKQGSESGRAKEIFDRLWSDIPGRYESEGSFRLTDVLDAQLGGSTSVGNCLGLTVLYNVLARPFGLKVGAAHLESAFGRGPHVFTVLHTGRRSIDIENIFADGFDYRAHRVAPQREGWGDRGLIADVYHSAGNELAVDGEWQKAIELYEKALVLNPGYVRAYLNRGIALVESGRLEDADAWFRSQARQRQQRASSRRRGGATGSSRISSATAAGLGRGYRRA